MRKLALVVFLSREHYPSVLIYMGGCEFVLCRVFQKHRSVHRIRWIPRSLMRFSTEDVSSTNPAEMELGTDAILDLGCFNFAGKFWVFGKTCF